jgi:hypothetical protein
MIIYLSDKTFWFHFVPTIKRRKIFCGCHVCSQWTHITYGRFVCISFVFSLSICFVNLLSRMNSFGGIWMDFKKLLLENLSPYLLSISAVINNVMLRDSHKRKLKFTSLYMTSYTTLNKSDMQQIWALYLVQNYT